MPAHLVFAKPALSLIMIAFAASVVAAQPAAAQYRPAPVMPRIETGPAIRVEPIRPVEPVRPLELPPLQSAPSIQSAPPAAPPTRAVTLPFCDQHPERCRPHHAHGGHPHPSHSDAQCPCEWYDYRTQRWVSGQYARSCCR